jgi:hypothetical protein
LRADKALCEKARKSLLSLIDFEGKVLDEGIAWAAEEALLEKWNIRNGAQT